MKKNIVTQNIVRKTFLVQIDSGNLKGFENRSIGGSEIWYDDKSTVYRRQHWRRKSHD